ncbi:MAG: DUF1553 domain-containing protein [Acidobacteria bacterium]|nr:DUF1553 domain-containing protein [Acidobacteriota bacterium]
MRRLSSRHPSLAALCATAVLLAGAGLEQVRAATPSAADLELFEDKIRPLLAAQCYSCHGAEKQFAGLRLDSRQGLLDGGKSGPAVLLDDPPSSPLLRALRGETLRMPLGGALSEAEIAAVANWVERGAPWSEAREQSDANLSGEDRYSRLLREHWAFQPVGRPTPPAVADSGWSQHPVDRFLAARLAEAGLVPAPPADRAVLIRRLWRILTGLPPSADDIRDFVDDPSPDAYDKLVDRLLASPRFGERWGRHWLDLVRYAETRGYEWNYEIVGAWRYRDYVIRAFNEDVPYNQLVREHIAGDLLPNPRIDQSRNINESAIGTAFYRLGEAGHDDCVQFRGIALDVIDNEIDVLSKTFQGMTVGCARCHDHKLDPIPTTDYYGLYSILNSSRATTHTIDTPAATKTVRDQLAALKGSIRQELAKFWTREAANLSDQLRPAESGDEESEPTLDDPAYLLRALAAAEDQGKPFAEVFAEAAGRLRSERKARRAHNADDFQSFGDFRTAEPEGWSLSGSGLLDGPSPSGDFAVQPEGEAALRAIYPAGRYSHILSARLNGAIRSPWLPRQAKKLSLLAMGGNLGARRTVIDNCAIGEDYKFVESSRPQWITLDVQDKWNDLPVFVELVTRWDNPRIPDRPGRIKDPELALIDSPESYFGIVRAVFHDGDQPPQPELEHWAPLLDGPAPTNRDDLQGWYQDIAAQAIERWSRGDATDEDVVWLSWFLGEGLLSNRADATPALAELIGRYRNLEQELPEPRVVEGLEDAGAGQDFPVLIAGAADSPGKPAPRRFLSRLFGEGPLTQNGSGRRELAELIAAEDNPLTARVMVNRVWHHLFGRGIVATVDDFGSLGERPSHPELLDYLARRFTDDGWSVKRLIRFLVTSRAFRQSGETTEGALTRDPQNALLHHYAMRRLSAEEVRDSLLSVAGELRADLYGPSVDPYRKRPKDYRRLFSGPLLGDGRRSLYLKVTRMEGSGFLETFDFPMPSTTRGARDSTTVPAQSLTLLNDPFVAEVAASCSRRVLSDAGGSLPERIDALFEAILAREPTADERRRFTVLADRLQTLEAQDGEAQNGEGQVGEAAVFRDLAHVLLTTKEFLYVR